MDSAPAARGEFLCCCRACGPAPARGNVKGNVKGCRAACRWGGLGWRGTAKTASCVPRFAPSMALNAPANPLRPTFDRSMAAFESVAPTHGRRNVSANGPLRSPTMGRRYRFSLIYYAAGGHWGWAWALSAMDGGVHVIAFALPLPRFASQTVGPVSSAPRPRRFAAAPDSWAPSTRRVNDACGSADPWSAECSRQRPAALADHGSALPLFSYLLRGWRPRNLSGGRAVGRGGGVECHGWHETRPAWMRLLPSPVPPLRPAPSS